MPAKKKKKQVKKAVKKPKKTAKKATKKASKKTVKKPAKKTVKVAKKPAKKPVAKKKPSAVKKAVKKKVSIKKKKTKRLTHPDARPEQFFMLADGRVLKNVHELADALDTIEDHVFHHHVGEGRNDFAAWIRDVFRDVELAEHLIRVDNKRHAQIIIYKHITRRLA